MEGLAAAAAARGAGEEEAAGARRMPGMGSDAPVRDAGRGRGTRGVCVGGRSSGERERGGGRRSTARKRGPALALLVQTTMDSMQLYFYLYMYTYM